MKRTAAAIFLLFYVSFTFLVQIERTLDWLESFNGDAGPHSAAIQAQPQHSRQTRIAEAGFILHGFENTAALPEVDTDIVSSPVERVPAPLLLNIRPRSPPVNTQVAS